jgi:hypothetical protein
MINKYHIHYFGFLSFVIAGVVIDLPIEITNISIRFCLNLVWLAIAFYSLIRMFMLSSMIGRDVNQPLRIWFHSILVLIYFWFLIRFFIQSFEPNYGRWVDSSNNSSGIIVQKRCYFKNCEDQRTIKIFKEYSWVRYHGSDSNISR